MMTRELTKAGEREITVLVDNDISAQNVGRFLKNAGYAVERIDSEDVTRLEAVLSDEAAKQPQAGLGVQDAAPSSDYAYLILSNMIGARSDGLGEVLMKSFLGTIGSREPLPRTIALMNEGVKLAQAGETTASTLSGLEARGVTLLVCGTCTRHFGITDNIEAGQISNMFEIAEAVFGTSKPIVMS
jgi:selenium metabolism protein YedF